MRMAGQLQISRDLCLERYKAVGRTHDRKSTRRVLKAAGSGTLLACAPHGATCRRARGMAAASSSDIALGTRMSSRAATINVGRARLSRHGGGPEGEGGG